MLDIRQGFLPPDNTQIDPSTVLEAWVAGTTVFNLPGGAFTGGKLQFVVSQTEAPATGERTVGMLWFARGEGILYVWDDTFEAPKNWIAVAGRRDVWVQSMEFASPKGCPLVPLQCTPSSNPAATVVTQWPDVGFGGDLGGAIMRPIWTMFALTMDSSGHSGGQVSEMTFISLEAITAGGIGRAVELGFCDALMQSAYTGAGGFFGTSGRGGGNPPSIDNFNLNSQSPVTEVEGGTIIGVLTDSSATVNSTNWLRRVYKFAVPPITNTGEF